MGVLPENRVNTDSCKNSCLGMQEHTDEGKKHCFKMVSRRVKYNKMSQCSSVRHA